MSEPIIDVNCVFGRDHHRHLVEVLIPSLFSASRRNIRFNVINYAGPSELDEFPAETRNVTVRLFKQETGKAIGFAEAHNILAAQTSSRVFIIINPDCIMHEAAIDFLIERYYKAPGTVGLVEGRQWPFEHPKEYDPLDLTTPWASGAFCLFNTEMYKKIGGMDERYFLYLEDVDISWRMWLEGAAVLYEPRSVITHFTGGYFYRDDLLENEKYYSIRNFVLLMRKFYGEEGEQKAIFMLSSFPDQEIVKACLEDIEENFADFQPLNNVNFSKAPKIKVTGINQFHEIRS